MKHFWSFIPKNVQTIFGQIELSVQLMCYCTICVGLRKGQKINWKFWIWKLLKRHWFDNLCTIKTMQTCLSVRVFYCGVILFHKDPLDKLNSLESERERGKRGEKQREKTCPLYVTILKHKHVDTVQNDFHFQWLMGNSNRKASSGFTFCLWPKQATACHYCSPCPENHVGAYTKRAMATSRRKRPEWNLHSLVRDQNAFLCCWETGYLAINYRCKYRKIYRRQPEVESKLQGVWRTIVLKQKTKLKAITVTSQEMQGRRRIWKSCDMAHRCGGFRAFIARVTFDHPLWFALHPA